jgi:hypothetical protein
MDPSLAPGYVRPNNGKDKVKRGHHWAEVQKAKAASTNGSDADIDASDSSPDSSTTSPQIQPVVPEAQASASPGRPVMARHLRMASWRGARSALSDGEGIGGPADLEEVPIGVKRQAIQLHDYAFPEHRLRTVMDGMKGRDFAEYR